MCRTMEGASVPSIVTKGANGAGERARRRGTSAKTRNDRRKIVIGMMDPVARLVLAAGLVRPFFAPGPDDFWPLVGAVLAAIVLWGGAAYLIASLEDEE